MNFLFVSRVLAVDKLAVNVTPNIRQPGVPQWRASATLSPCRPETKTLSAALYGEALLAARRPELQPLIDHLRGVAQGRDDLRTECAGVIAGSWFSGAARRGEDLIAAGLLMLAGPVDLAEFDRWVRVGWERLRGASEPYRESS